MHVHESHAANSCACPCLVLVLFFESHLTALSRSFRRLSSCPLRACRVHVCVCLHASRCTRQCGATANAASTSGRATPGPSAPSTRWTTCRPAARASRAARSGGWLPGSAAAPPADNSQHNATAVWAFGRFNWIFHTNLWFLATYLLVFFLYMPILLDSLCAFVRSLSRKPTKTTNPVYHIAS